jgi:hypothetical protein
MMPRSCPARIRLLRALSTGELLTRAVTPAFSSSDPITGQKKKKGEFQKVQKLPKKPRMPSFRALWTRGP